MAELIPSGTPNGSGPTRLTLAVVTWNDAAHLPGLVSSLPAALDGAPAWELIVADNASADRTLEVVAELAPAAKVVQLGRNGGYAAAFNAAVAAASPSSEAVMILNPDLKLMEGSLRRLVDALQVPGTGIAVPRFVDPRGKLQYSLRRDPTVLRALSEALLGGARAGRFGLGELVMDRGRYERSGLAEWASGAAMLMSRQCLHMIGPWDESFLLYSEETDYAWRARRRGFALRYVPDAVVVHQGGPTDKRWTLLTINRVRMFTKHHSKLQGKVFHMAVIVNEGLRALLGRSKHRAALKALLHPSQWSPQYVGWPNAYPDGRTTRWS